MEIKDIIALIIGAIIGIIIIVYMVTNQKSRVMEWLKTAVVYAEKELGTGTGQLKLRMVYDWFCGHFPVVSSIIPFKVFSAWVDVALETMRDWIDKNKNIAVYIKPGGTLTEVRVEHIKTEE